MSPKKHEETEEEKTIQQTIADEIAKRFIPIYWGLGGLGVFILGVIFTLTGPLSAEVLEQSKTIQQMITADKAFDRFLTKDSYHQLQKDEHLSDIEAIQNPQNADVIYMRQNSRESEKLGVSYNRSGNSNN